MIPTATMNTRMRHANSKTLFQSTSWIPIMVQYSCRPRRRLGSASLQVACDERIDSDHLLRFDAGMAEDSIRANEDRPTSSAPRRVECVAQAALLGVRRAGIRQNRLPSDCWPERSFTIPRQDECRASGLDSGSWIMPRGLSKLRRSQFLRIESSQDGNFIPCSPT